MAIWCDLCVLIYLVSKICMAQQCFDSQTQTLEGSLVGQKLEESPFSKLSSLGPLDCYRNCRRHSLCQAVNFQSVSYQCELLSEAGGNFVTNMTYNFIDVRSWTHDFLGNCNQHNCSNNTYCEEDIMGFSCIPFGCMGVPSSENVNTTSFTSKLLWNLNESVLYVCNRGYYPSQNVFCEYTGNFTTFICKPFEKCFDIRECNPTAEEGEFIIYSSKISAWLKLFCQNMYGAYITLVYNNFATFRAITRSNSTCQHVELDPSTIGAGETNFHRLRYLLANGKIKTFSSFYQTTTHTRQEFGSAGDCYVRDNSSQCGVLGYFRIDFRDTGLRIAPTTTWELYGNDSAIVNITKSYDDQVIEGHCGGNCGGCRAGQYINVEAYPYYVPQMEFAFSCMNLTL
ncbi:hypothetical protein LOTGIDRAFT_170500 [Lottia gigantea]|uniref:GON domain-containing protein n=1 Tax=Lottia gigantea TaxID=225164 RepID=V4B186_LOTGI|nr:hypothetical protein LOTGIDRAFT_170500 [Lottia gigantea]ESO81964.1 hypothetical protein LOTGIDRAFT_170500 [Lottia gigantea]